MSTQEYNPRNSTSDGLQRGPFEEKEVSSKAIFQLPARHVFLPTQAQEAKADVFGSQENVVVDTQLPVEGSKDAPSGSELVNNAAEPEQHVGQSVGLRRRKDNKQSFKTKASQRPKFIEKGGKKGGQVQRMLQEQLSASLAREKATTDVAQQKSEEKDEAIKEMLRNSVKVVDVWSLVGRKFIHDPQFDTYTYTDGPNSQLYQLRPAQLGEVVERLPGHAHTLRVVSGSANPDSAITMTWGHEELVREVCWLLRGQYLGTKKARSLLALSEQAVAMIKTRCTVWPQCQTQCFKFLESEEYANAVLNYHREALVQQPVVREAMITQLAATVDADLEDVKFVVTTLKEDLYSRWWVWVLKHKNDFYSGCGFLFMITLMFILDDISMAKGKHTLPTIISFWCTMIGLFLTFQIPTIKPGALRLLSAVSQGQATVKYASIIDVDPVCSGNANAKEHSLLSTWSMKPKSKVEVKFGKQEKPCDEPKPYHPYGTIIENVPVVCPAGCRHDQANGCAIRFFFDRQYNASVCRVVPAKAKGWVAELFRKNQASFRMYTEDEWLSHLPPKRAAMIRAAEIPSDLSLVESVDIFVKKEAYLGKDPKNFKPRIIMGRQLGFERLVGPYFYSVSKWIAKVFNKDTDMVYCSGMSPLEVGKLATRAFAERLSVFEADVSNWDGSLNPKWLDFEKWFIEECCPFLPPRWEELSKGWSRVEGHGKDGVSFRTCHGRRSGDMWTSCFNTLINIIIVKHCCPDALVGALGDDNFFSTNLPVDVDQMVEFYQDLGMKVKLKKVESLYTLSFCSGKFYWTDQGNAWGVSAFRILAKFGLNLKRHEKKHKELIYGTAVSMLPIAGHVPLISTLLRSIVRSGERQRLDPILDYELMQDWRVWGPEILHVTAHAEQMFLKQYHLTTEEYLVMDAQLDDACGCCGDQLSHFPMVFSGSAYFEGARVDCDFEGDGMPSKFTLKFNPSTKPPLIDVIKVWYVLIGAPILEELAKWLWWPMAVFIGGYESVRDNTLDKLFLHLFFFLLTAQNLCLGIFVHSLYNFSVYYKLTRRDYACVLGIQVSKIRRRLVAVGGVFTPMPDCSPTINSKDNGHPGCSEDNTPLNGKLECVAKQNQNYRKTPMYVPPHVLQQQRKKLKPVSTSVKSLIKSSDLLKTVISPFDPRAGGQKIPDKNNFPSLTYSINQSFRPTIDSNGRAVYAMYPFGVSHVVKAHVTTGNYNTPYSFTSGQTETDIQNWSNYITNFAAYRTVGAGIRIKCDGSINNMTGRVYVVDVPIIADNWFYANDYMPQTVAEATSQSHTYREYTMFELMDKGIECVFKRTDSSSELYIQSAEDYNASQQPADLKVVWPSRGWAAKFILFEGLPASANCIEIQSVLHIETIGTPRNAVITATPAAPPNTRAVDSMYLASQNLPPAAKQDEDIFSIISDGIGKGVDLFKKAYGAYETVGPLLDALLI